MLLLAIELSKGGEHASNFTHSERKYKHKHFHNYEKTGSTLWFLTEFRRFFLTVPRMSTRVFLIDALGDANLFRGAVISEVFQDARTTFLRSSNNTGS
jgi:hypothetical protein